MTTKEPRPTNPLTIYAAIGGAALGAALPQYTGSMALIPLSGAILVGALAHRLVGPAAKPMVPALAVQSGQLLWFLFGMVTTGQFDTGILDTIILVVGLTWLMVRPGLAPVLLLGIYQSVGLISNAIGFAAAAVGGQEHKALLLHLVFRAVALAMLVTGLRNLRSPKPIRCDEPISSISGRDHGDPDSLSK